MQKHFFHIIFLVGIISCTFINNVRADHYLYTRLTEQSWMLPKVKTIYKENGKYLWIGTNKGVYRFDGYDFKYYQKKEQTSTIHGTTTNHISMDTRGNLWALTNKGIGIYNRQKDCFEWASKDDETKGPFFMTCLVDDGVLFSGRGKIVFYDFTTKAFSLFKDLRDSEKIHNIRYMYNPDGKYLFFDYGNLIAKMDIQKKKISPTICPTLISCMFLDSEQRIWAGCYDKSLTCFNEEGHALKEFSSNNSNLSDEVILCMEQQDSLIWIGTDGGGINILDTNSNQIKTLRHVRGESHSLPTNSISCLYKDIQRTIWAGSIRCGIIAIRKSPINSYTEVHEHSSTGLSNPTILSFYQDGNDDYVWIGTDGEGINRLNLNDRTFEHFPSTKGTKVVSIARYNEHTLLLSLYMKGIFFFDTRTGNLRTLNVNKKELTLKMLLSRTDINLYNQTSDIILALTDKIYKYNKKMKVTEEIPFDSRQGFNNILPIGKFNDDLFLHNEATIYKVDSSATHIETVLTLHNGQEIKTSSMNDKGIIWLVTNQGIAYYSIQERKLYHTQNPLLKDISTIAIDKLGRIWMGEEDKLYAYSDSTKHLAIFGKSDGVLPNDFIEKSHFVTQQGDVMFGGTRGLTIVDRNFKLTTNERPVISITGLKIDEQEYNEYNLNGLSSIRIPAESKSVEIQVAAMEEDILRSKIYRYEIRGENEQTIESHSPHLTLHAFSPGESKVYVSCSTRNGEWTMPTQVTTLFFMPPWYETGWFYTTCVLIVVLIGTGIIITIFRRKDNKLKLELKEKERSIYEEKVNFLININHELRTPLTLICGPLQRILQDSSHALIMTKTLQKVYNQAERMKRLLNMVLDLRKMEVGESAMKLQNIPVNKWIEEVVSDFSYDDSTGPKICTRLDKTINLVTFDKEKCEIILTNLLMNAIKHSSEQGVIIISSAITSDNMLTISVRDEGNGINIKDADKLFDRFYQGNSEESGSGIGLSYAKMLTRLHKGEIGAFNNETKGATFYFKIPLNLEEGNTPCAKEPYLNELFSINNNTPVTNSLVDSTELDTSHKSILIVDDNIELTEFLKESFANRFKDIYTAHDGKEAFEIASKGHIDVIISDIMMPKMDGYELCQQVKSHVNCSHIPVILLTAMNEEQSKRLGYKMGADAYIAKPFEIETLYVIIKSKLKIREDIKQKYMQLSVLPEPQQNTFSQIDENFLINLNKIVVDNIGNPSLDIPFVCKEIHMSRASLYNKLKALTGMSCNEYINKIRIERAIFLVKSTSKSFIEIADETGFANSRYFSTSFKQNTGMTPTQYRKEYRTNS